MGHISAGRVLEELRPLGDDAVRTFYVERARGLTAQLQAREDQCTAERRIPTDNIQDLKDAGLFRLARPARFGGADVDFDVCLRVAEELAQGCGSTAWVYGVLILHDWFMKLWPDEVQSEVWSGDLDVLISSSLQPRPVRRVEGGYILNGNWPFSSGCDHSGWTMVGGLAEGVTPRLMLVRLDECEIVDDWRTLGLRGTGSKTLRFVDVFVAERYAVELAGVMRIESRSESRLKGSAWDDTPVYASGDAFACVIAGMARRSLELVCSSLRTKVSRGVKLADVELYQLRIGEASATIDLARFSLIEGSRSIARRIRAGERVPQAEADRRMRDIAVMVRRLRDAVDMLALCHSSWIYDTDPLQRLHRDVFTAATHFSGRWENFVLPAGKSLIQNGM